MWAPWREKHYYLFWKNEALRTFSEEEFVKTYSLQENYILEKAVESISNLEFELLGEF
jgi:hypothetical protein